MPSDGYLFPTAGFVLRSLLDTLDESGQQWTEPQATADIMLALDRGDLKPYRYYAERWGWSKSRVYRNMGDLKARARRWRQFQSRDSEPEREPDQDTDRDNSGTERNASGTERNASGTERNAETCLTALNADFGTRAGQSGTQAGHCRTLAGQHRTDNRQQITDNNTPTPPTARARGDGAATETDPDPPEPSAPESSPPEPSDPSEEGRDPWWFLPERDSVYRPEMEKSAERYSPTSLDELIRRHWGGYRQGKVPLSSLGDLLEEQQDEYGKREGFRRLIAGIVISAGEADTPGLKFLKSVLDNLDHYRQQQDEQSRSDRRRQPASADGGDSGGHRGDGAPPDRGGAW